MANTNLGKVAVTMGGNFTLGTAYTRLTEVYDTTTNATYRAKKDNQNVALTDTTTWQKVSQGVGTGTGASDNNYDSTAKNKVDALPTAAPSSDNGIALMADLSQHNSQPSLAKYAQDMLNSQTVSIECYGDSTTYGRVSGGLGQVTTPAPLQMQNVLRAYYQNANITVTNKGIDGDQTTNALRSWDTTVGASTAQIIFINYGINDMLGTNPAGVSDAAITAEQFRKNIRNMVLIARNHGKTVVLQTTNIITISNSYDGVLGAQGIKQFADVIRQVGKELSVFITDINGWTEKMLAKSQSVFAAFPDGIHPSQGVYIQIGLIMAQLFIAPNAPTIDNDTIISAATTQFSSGVTISSAILQTAGSEIGCTRFSKAIRIPIFIGTTGLDIYVAVANWSLGSENASVIVDGVTIGALNLKDTNYVIPKMAVDREIRIIENVQPGFHLMEIVSQDNAEVGINYVRVKSTKKLVALDSQFSGTSASVFEKECVLQDFDVGFAKDAAEQHIILNIPTCAFLRAFSIYIVAQFPKMTGFALFNSKTNSQGIHGGLYVFSDPTTGFLDISEEYGFEETGKGTFGSLTTLGSTDLSLATHEFCVNVSTSRVATIILDGAQMGTHTLANPNSIGGFLGLYADGQAEDKAIRIQKAYIV